jgi:hypothetical protein
MTVARLIELLEKIEDKENTLVFTYQNNFEGEWSPAISAAEPVDEEEIGVYIA